MQSPKQNFLETLKVNGKPDRLVKQYEATVFVNNNPIVLYERGERYEGMQPKKDKWGTTVIWPKGYVAPMPHITEETKVIRDVTHWRDYVEVPDYTAACSDDALWESYYESIAKIDREKYLVLAYMPTGVFERLHFLMGFEDALVNLLLEPEAMHDLLTAIGKHRFEFAKLLVERIKPDAILSHDDWGSKNSLFMQPETWREFIKPQYVETYGYLHDQGVLILHHADSYCEPLVEDMIDLHIDVWQGVLPQNDIAAIQKQAAGRMTLMGGLDAAIVDKENSTEEEIRKEVRRACATYGPGGHFIPCITYGGPGTIYPQNDVIINDEIDRYNREVYHI
jgi:hypothetical protein